MAFISNTTNAFYRNWKDRLVPGLRHSQYAYKDVLEAHLHPRTRWLDAGCGHGVFPSWMKERGQSLVERCDFVVGLDCDCPSLWENQIVDALVAGDLSDLPFQADSFDVVSANMVVEHLSEPDRVGQALYRVLKPGGVFIFHTPNYLNYQTVLASLIPQRLKYKLIEFMEGRAEKDAFPTFYRLNTDRAVRQMAERQGFTVREVRRISSTPETFRFGPAVLLLEMLLIRVTDWRPFRAFRSNLVAVLEKPVKREQPRRETAAVQAGR
jgi:SAM-dependent methyltransferase